MNTKEMIERIPSKYISESDRALFLSVISTRGKNKGYLLASAPSDKMKKAIWFAIIGQLAPARLGICFLMFADDNHKKEYDRLDKIARTLQTALNASEPAFRWNLWAHRNDSKIVIDYITTNWKKA